MKHRFLIILSLLAILSGCGEYNKVLKSYDYNLKYDYAKKAFENKKYTQAYTILADLVPIFKGTEKGEECLYLLGLSYYENHDYLNSGSYFRQYYTQYPRGRYAELARFYAGYGYYLDSPEPQLDQSETLRAIEELQAFIDYFPKSDKVAIAQNAIFELQDKLVLKELENAQLYFNLGGYLGNNYESAVITAKNAIKDYPYTKYKEKLEFLILKSRFKEAQMSVDEKKEERFRTVVDEYYAFINDFPNSENRKEADNMFKVADKFLNGK
jgi:outer membrane protein assembly factor BamD